MTVAAFVPAPLGADAPLRATAVGTPPSGAVLLADGFRRAAVGSADTGQAWTVAQGVPSCSSAGLSKTTAASAELTQDCGHTNLDIALTVNFLATAGGDRRVLIEARRPSTSNRVFAQFSRTTDTVRISRTVSGSTTVLGESGLLGLADNVPYRLRFEQRGPLLLASLNGVLLAAALDATQMGQTLWSLFMVDTGVSSWLVVTDLLVRAAGAAR